MKSAVAWFTGNHVAANLLMLFFLVAGIITGLTMKIEVFPEMELAHHFPKNPPSYYISNTLV